MNKKMWKLFGEAFLKTLIVILGIAIVIFAIYFLIQIFGGGSSQDADDDTISTVDLDSSESEDTTASTEATTEEATTAEAISSVGYNIEVLNSTDTALVAAGWQTTLTDAGFTVASIGNYETEALTSTKIIVSQDGMGEDLLEYFQNATIEVGTINSEAEVQIDIQIIIGTEDIQ